MTDGWIFYLENEMDYHYHSWGENVELHESNEPFELIDLI
jgi:hypothetical protein